MFGCSIVIALILVAQLYWLGRVYTLEEHQFKVKVLKSIRGLFRNVDITDETNPQLRKKVELIDPNTYLVKLDSIPSKESLQTYLAIEFEDFNVWTNCIVAVYSEEKKGYLYQYYLQTAASHFPEIRNINMPVVKKDYDYLLLNFPYRSKYIIHEMLFWIVTAVFMLLILVGLTISLLYLYRQKFLNELQKDFVNNFTHEFKTPLAVIKIASDVLVQPGIGSNPERLKKYGNVVKEQTEHLQNQVERLLRTAAVDEKLIVKKEACQLNLLIGSALDQIEPLTTEKKAIIDFIPDDNEPVIFVDKSLMKLVIINLIENAVKYSIGQPHITVQLNNTDNGVYSISVKDNGIGIEEKNIKFLFKKFYRVPTGNVHAATGFGLGLNFVKKVVDAHDGKIFINSLPGIGTEFKIHLPKK